MAPGRHETERLARPALRFKPVLEPMKPANTAGLAAYASPPPSGSRLPDDRCAGLDGRLLHLAEEAALPRHVRMDGLYAGLQKRAASAAA